MRRVWKIFDSFCETVRNGWLSEAVAAVKKQTDHSFGGFTYSSVEVRQMRNVHRRVLVLLVSTEPLRTTTTKTCDMFWKKHFVASWWRRGPLQSWFGLLIFSRAFFFNRSKNYFDIKSINLRRNYAHSFRLLLKRSLFFVFIDCHKNYPVTEPVSPVLCFFLKKQQLDWVMKNCMHLSSPVDHEHSASLHKYQSLLFTWRLIL